MEEIGKPSVGRIVHAKLGGDEPCAAIITAVRPVFAETDGDEEVPGDREHDIVVTLFPEGPPMYGIGLSRDDAGERDSSWRFPPRV